MKVCLLGEFEGVMLWFQSLRSESSPSFLAIHSSSTANSSTGSKFIIAHIHVK